MEIFAHRADIPAERIAMVSRTSGNLGSATCGVSLCTALTRAQRDFDNFSAPSKPLIFVAAVGPGLVWAGAYIH
jgi:3-oxoacyl-[acyl-carrier-protein] synthase III